MIRILLVATLGICAVLGTGCSSAGDSAPPLLAAYDSNLMAAPMKPEPCANHEEGCPCDDPAETTDCGRIQRVAGDYVWCSTGRQTCTMDGVWSKCTGDQLAAAPASK